MQMIACRTLSAVGEIGRTGKANSLGFRNLTASVWGATICRTARSHRESKAVHFACTSWPEEKVSHCIALAGKPDADSETQ